MQHYRFIDSEKHPILVGKVNREAVERGSAEEVQKLPALSIPFCSEPLTVLKRLLKIYKFSLLKGKKNTWAETEKRSDTSGEVVVLVSRLRSLVCTGSVRAGTAPAPMVLVSAGLSQFLQQCDPAINWQVRETHLFHGLYFFLIVPHQAKLFYFQSFLMYAFVHLLHTLLCIWTKFYHPTYT